MGRSKTFKALNDINLKIYKNGSALEEQQYHYSTGGNFLATQFLSVICDMNGSSDYIEMIGYIDVTSGTPRFTTGTKATFFGAYRIGS